MNSQKKNIEEIHNIIGLEPVNTRMYLRLEKLWLGMEGKEEELFQASEIENINQFSDHAWWPRASKKVFMGEPQPKYVT